MASALLKGSVKKEGKYSYSDEDRVDLALIDTP